MCAIEQKFNFYYERYLNHMDSLKMAQQQLDKAVRMHGSLTSSDCVMLFGCPRRSLYPHKLKRNGACFLVTSSCRELLPCRGFRPAPSHAVISSAVL